ncbi:hypothetical protein IC575_022651 [Cucumis melo]|uniref:Subtilisin-like protease SBT1.7 n=1 Tax=Cucumis melo TaxID=3656 RepID=A0A1S3ATZ7_CUCME|nr:subtilisin-like protease 4 [Cucumis melo]
MVLLPSLFLLLLLNFHGYEAQVTELPLSNLHTYIVHVKKPEVVDDLEIWHRSFLPTSLDNEEEQPTLLYSYRNVMSGFSARLTEEHVKAMEEKDGFVSARRETIVHLHTTHTPDFLGLNRQFGFWKDSNFGKGVIIGVLDGGITPNHPSFDDAGMAQPPAKWKGRCEFNFSACNNKLIGARSMNLASQALKGKITTLDDSPIDEDGHGTHTASTAAGTFVDGAEALGNAFGTAVGMAPLAHLAIYKVCFGEDCSDVDILAGLDAAVEDGVDVLSISLGGPSVPFFADITAIGSFAAIQKGIFVSCSAANSGPFNATLSNEAPWILTVAASTIDRKITATAKLGNGEEFDGESLFQPNDFPQTLLPLVFPGEKNETVALCAEGSLKNIDVKGKVVVCERGGGIARIAKGVEVKNGGGAAMILLNAESDGFTTEVDAHVLPASHVSHTAALKIKAYINSTTYPTATILFKGTTIGDDFSPAIASFSSRGPSLASPGILKPDITGPGVSILAAWPFPLDNNTNTKSTFNIISGTSMSCPHLSGIAALIKSAHPDWSPAAIKSSIMTTANITNLEGNPILDETLQPADLFAIGAGHVNPSKAIDPGLVYDIQPDDYIPYLCGLGYTNNQVSLIAHKPIDCLTTSSIPEGELNYPSFMVKLGPVQTFSRTVTSVGSGRVVYNVVIEAPEGVSVTVRPRKLSFSALNQKATYSVTFKRSGSISPSIEFAEGYLKWVSAKHVVRSPISVKFV